MSFISISWSRNFLPVSVTNHVNSWVTYNFDRIDHIEQRKSNTDTPATIIDERKIIQPWSTRIDQGAPQWGNDLHYLTLNIQIKFIWLCFSLAQHPASKQNASMDYKQPAQWHINKKWFSLLLTSRLPPPLLPPHRTAPIDMRFFFVCFAIRYLLFLLSFAL